MRSQLRTLPALTGDAPPIDFAALPADPLDLFTTWLQHAVAAGVEEPHAMTLSTVGDKGMVDARVLVLKDVDTRGWAFASTKSSIKGQQLAQHPYAALTFWWQPLVRSVRLRGPVIESSREENLADLRARSAAAQRDVNPDDWAVWRLQPTRVEFWQGAQDRRHTRIVYAANGDQWHMATENIGERV
ncbi:pyridoxal 5'-phosphate synthase [Enteractinococcus fodinae]|uniref:Pyridoxamine 5'-phosphate oxidase n=1 Tax=Enteractinococcus fodinae TaxID=684663 RepID=A0ABU2AZ34_9MICC|nr:pyridoxamine 5'-phosphate oxidase family protein [Enteractinococcus fodinae]MDR7346605.1 pyridoxamine 5'-phosphate oxidase [Enteractinococcus fodinae]